MTQFNQYEYLKEKEIYLREQARGVSQRYTANFGTKLQHMPLKIRFLIFKVKRQIKNRFKQNNFKFISGFYGGKNLVSDLKNCVKQGINDGFSAGYVKFQGSENIAEIKKPKNFFAKVYFWLSENRIIRGIVSILFIIFLVFIAIFLIPLSLYLFSIFIGFLFLLTLIYGIYWFIKNFRGWK